MASLKIKFSIHFESFVQVAILLKLVHCIPQDDTGVLFFSIAVSRIVFLFYYFHIITLTNYWKIPVSKSKTKLMVSTGSLMASIASCRIGAFFLTSNLPTVLSIWYDVARINFRFS
jgi:hypothetical protein